MNTRFTLLFLCFALLLGACSGSKKAYKRGLVLEQADMLEEASSKYLEALDRNTNNLDAKIALKRVGQVVLDRRLSEVFKGNASDNHKAAVYAYLSAQGFSNDVSKRGVQLSVPGHYEQYFQESKNKYLAQLYEQGVDELTEERFQKADAIFAEILRLDPEYKDVSTLRSSSTNEPLYRSALRAMDGKDFKEAYKLFDKIFRNDRAYKDVAELRAIAKREATLTVSFLPFSNLSPARGVEEKFRASLISQLTNMNHPFLEVVDRDNMEAILNEQKLAMSGLIDEKSAAKMGELLGVKAVIIGKVVEFRHSTGQLRGEEKTAFESYTAQRYDTTLKKNVDEIRYRPVRYSEFSNSKQLNISFQYQLISSETGRILASNIVNKTESDEIRYANYRGDYRNLFPAGNGNSVVTNANARSSLTNSFTSRKELKTNEEIAKSAYVSVAQQVAGDLRRFLD
jgi:tetratricopeptide (TPR) repeat protein